MAFSYLSTASSRKCRACSECVESGIEPKSCWPTAATRGALVSARSAAFSTCGAGACAQALQAQREGKIKRKKRAANRVIETHSPFLYGTRLALMENVS